MGDRSLSPRVHLCMQPCRRGRCTDDGDDDDGAVVHLHSTALVLSFRYFRECNILLKVLAMCDVYTNTSSSSMVASVQLVPRLFYRRKYVYIRGFSHFRCEYYALVCVLFSSTRTKRHANAATENEMLCCPKYILFKYTAAVLIIINGFHC